MENWSWSVLDAIGMMVHVMASAITYVGKPFYIPRSLWFLGH